MRTSLRRRLSHFQVASQRWQRDSCLQSRLGAPSPDHTTEMGQMHWEEEGDVLEQQGPMLMVLPGQCQEHLALPWGKWLATHELFPSPMDGVSSVLHRQRVCSRWALDRTLCVHLLRHPWEHTWSVSVRSMQLIPDIKFTSIGLLGQCWKESAGVAQGWWRRAWRIARDVFRASGRMCALCKSYSLMLKLLPACILLQTAKLVSIFPTHFTF